jgi:predicted amidohydrolase
MKISVIQHNIKWQDRAVNLKQYQSYIDKILETDIIVLPEMFTTGFTMKPSNFFEEMNGETIKWMKGISLNKNCAITGSLIIKENDYYYNRLIWCSPDGSIQYYDKKHLFSYAGEDLAYTSGDNQIIIDYMGFKIKPLICYDLRFPVWSRHGDFDLLIYVANWPKVRLKAWRTLLKARAIENQSYVVGVNRTGEDGSGVKHSGNTSIIHPDGSFISCLFLDGFYTADIDIESIKNFRNRFPFLSDKDNFKIY